MYSRMPGPQGLCFGYSSDAVICLCVLLPSFRFALVFCSLDERINEIDKKNTSTRDITRRTRLHNPTYGRSTHTPTHTHTHPEDNSLYCIVRCRRKTRTPFLHVGGCYCFCRCGCRQSTGKSSLESSEVWTEFTEEVRTQRFVYIWGVITQYTTLQKNVAKKRDIYLGGREQQ